MLQALFMKCAIMPRIYGKPQDEENKENTTPVECDLKIRKITLLANTKEEFIKSFTINLPVTKVDKEFRKELLKTIKSNKGKKALSIKALDYQNQISVEFFSRKYKIDVNQDLIDFLEHHNLEYALETQIAL